MTTSTRAIGPGEGAASEPSGAPAKAGWVLAALIAVAAVANLGLAVANVALPSIGKHFDASQTSLNLVAVAYSLGLAASVLYFGAVGDRYGRKLLLIIGVFLTVPADCLAAWAPSIEVLSLDRPCRRADRRDQLRRRRRAAGPRKRGAGCADLRR